MIGVTISLLLLIASPASAFVEQLHPAGGRIPCHAMGAMLWFYVLPGGPTGQQLGTIIQREWVPDGWTPQDNQDNAALIALLGPASPLSQAEKETKAHLAEELCLLWESEVDEVDTPAEYRTRLGLAP
jgi:hypothetical protein